ncbi:hypothetical protein Trydic_g7842 [Trypoxylus dichotomus]
MRKPTLQTWGLSRDINIELIWAMAQVGTREMIGRMNSLRKQQQAWTMALLWRTRFHPKSKKRNCERNSVRMAREAVNSRWTTRFVGKTNECWKLEVALSYQAAQLVTRRRLTRAYIGRETKRRLTTAKRWTE